MVVDDLRSSTSTDEGDLSYEPKRAKRVRRGRERSDRQDRSLATRSGLLLASVASFKRSERSER